MCINPNDRLEDAADTARLWLDGGFLIGFAYRLPPHLRSDIDKLARAYLELYEDDDSEQRFRDERLAERRRLNNSPDAETT